jgi:Uncharacterized protein conserved in bacteria (DUF2252)
VDEKVAESTHSAHPTRRASSAGTPHGGGSQVGASSAVPGSGGDISALSRSGQVAVVGGVFVGVVRLLASVLAASDGRSAGPSAAMEPPESTCRHEMRQIQLDASVSNRGEPVKSDPGMMSLNPLDIDAMRPSAMLTYGELCAWTLARAHAKSGDSVAIAAYLGNAYLGNAHTSTRPSPGSPVPTLTRPNVTTRRWPGQPPRGASSRIEACQRGCTAPASRTPWCVGLSSG